MRQKILLTGSSGHLGVHISTLLQSEFKITGIDLRPGNFTDQVGNLTDKKFIENAVMGVDAIIHTASLHAPHVVTHSRQDFIDTNIIGTLNLLETAEKHQVRKFIYTSTTSLYGESLDDQNQAVWITENVPTIPRDIYDVTKIAAEGLCRDFFVKGKLLTTVLRVSRFWNEPMKKKVFYRMYRGVDVRDVATAHKLALMKDLDQFEIFNISAQSIFTKDDLFDLKHHANRTIQKKIPGLITYFNQKDWVMPDTIDRVYVIDKARKKLEYSPKFNIDYLLSDIL